MPKINFTEKELKQYFITNDRRGFYYKDAVELYDALSVHANGTYPKKIIEEARPHESAAVKAYREKIWKPKTKPIFSKIITSLNKIRRSTDWSIEYPKEEFPRIPEGETLEDFCEINYPNFKSITNWAFSVLLRQYLIDPNAVVAMLPKSIPEEESGFIIPEAIIFNSNNVLDYAEGDFCVLQNPVGAFYINDVGKIERGKAFYVITTMSILTYHQTNSRGDIGLVSNYSHGLEMMPAKKIGAVMTKAIDTDFLYESRVAGVVPSLDEAIREYSDLQAGIVMHLYPERWEYASVDCPDCKGTGLVPNEKGSLGAKQSVECGKCGGTGSKASPYSKIIVKRDALDAGAQIPIPPAGFIEKDVAILKLQDERVQNHILNALSAINMEFLAETPLAESGIAKEVDRDETNNFVHSVGEDIVRVMDWCYWTVAKYRYHVQHSDEEIEEMLPSIYVPEHFDIFSTKFIEEELKNSKDNKLNPVIISAMELGYASKKFSTEPEIRDRLLLILSLDPFSNVSEDDKMGRLTNNAISQIDYVISSNIEQFVDKAIKEDEKFPLKSFDEQRKKLEEYAQKIIDSNSAAKEVKVALGETEDDITGTDTEGNAGGGE